MTNRTHRRTAMLMVDAWVLLLPFGSARCLGMRQAEDFAAGAYLASLRSLQGEHAEAVSLIDSICHAFPGRSFPVAMTARIYRRAGRDQEADDALRNAIQLFAHPEPGEDYFPTGLFEAYLTDNRMGMQKGYWPPPQIRESDHQLWLDYSDRMSKLGLDNHACWPLDKITQTNSQWAAVAADRLHAMGR